MKRLLFLVLFLLPTTLVVSVPSSWAKTRVFACEPEWAAVAQEIGGEKLAVFSATHAAQDPHFIRARPSLISKIRKADIVFCSGASLEVGWLPLLIQKGARNLQPGKPGHLMAADFVETLEKPEKIDRSMGDLHIEGNPHVHLDPRNILIVAREFTARLEYIDRENAAEYRKNLESFSVRWQKAVSGWEKRAAALEGRSVVTHHNAWIYLLDWLGIHLAGTLEEKPGIPPSAGHLRELLTSVRGDPRTFAIIRTPYSPDNASEWFSKKTGIPEMELPYTVGGADGTDDLFSLFDRTIEILNQLSDDNP